MRKQAARHCALSLPNASDGALICLTVYRKGAAEVVRRLQQALEATQQGQDIDRPTIALQAQR